MDINEIKKTTLIRWSIASIGSILVASALLLATKQWESMLTIVLPSVAIYWMIWREDKLARQGYEFPSVGWPIKAGLFLLVPAISLSVVMFWFTRHLTRLQPWALYLVASFSGALMLVKVYERYLLVRRRLIDRVPITPV